MTKKEVEDNDVEDVMQETEQDEIEHKLAQSYQQMWHNVQMQQKNLADFLG